ncbi:unnamed protein product [Arctogadus glacialis]
MLNMGAVLLLLIGVTDGVKTFCDATQPHIPTQCFGSLGGTVECLFSGQQRVSCSAEGGGGGGALHYSLSPDGLPLNGTRLLSGPSSTSDVTLELGRTGLLSCSVRNNVSHAAANITLSVCGDHIPIIARSLTVGLLFLVAWGVYWALKMKKTSRHRDIALSSMAVDDGVLNVNVSGATGRAGGE